MISKKQFWKTFKIIALIDIILFVIIAIYFLFISESTLGINKTVGWAWDITNIWFWLGVLQIIVILFLVLSLITFLILSIKRRF